MSSIGRIFIVLNLILSAAFLGWAANALGSAQDYKQQLEAEQASHQADTERDAGKIGELTSLHKSATEEARGFREGRDQAKAESDSRKSELDEQRERNDRLQSDLTALQASLSTYNGRLDQLLAEKDRAVRDAEEARTAARDATDASEAAETKRRDAEEARATAEQKIADLEIEVAGLQESIAAGEAQLATLVAVTGVNLDDIRNQKEITAAVLDTRMDIAPGLVMLNVGKNQDVKRGYTFEIYRGSQYKGQVRVENVQDDVCTALVIRAVPGTTMGQGDSAATRL
jgi:hypothetical protein